VRACVHACVRVFVAGMGGMNGIGAPCAPNGRQCSSCKSFEIKREAERRKKECTYFVCKPCVDFLTEEGPNCRIIDVYGQRLEFRLESGHLIFSVDGIVQLQLVLRVTWDSASDTMRVGAKDFHLHQPTANWLLSLSDLAALASNPAVEFDFPKRDDLLSALLLDGSSKGKDLQNLEGLEEEVDECPLVQTNGVSPVGDQHVAHIEASETPPQVTVFSVGAVCCSVVSVVQCGVVWCSVVQCGAVWCSVVQCFALWCSVV